MSLYKTADHDETLVGRAKQGCKPAFDSLITMHYRRILYFVRRHIDNDSDAEDVTQETFIQVQRSLATFEGQSAFSTWVTGIAMNLVRNHVNRSPQYRYRFEGDDALELLSHDHGGPEESVALEALLDQVGEQLQQLSPDVREALMLIAVQGLSYEAVAEQTNTSVANVKNRVFRARRFLREALL